jgi:hypothetical protein
MSTLRSPRSCVDSEYFQQGRETMLTDQLNQGSKLVGPKLADDGFDLFHSYSLPILVSAGCALAAAIFILLLPKPAIIQDPEFEA